MFLIFHWFFISAVFNQWAHIIHMNSLNPITRRVKLKPLIGCQILSTNALQFAVVLVPFMQDFRRFASCPVVLWIDHDLIPFTSEDYQFHNKDYIYAPTLNQVGLSLGFFITVYHQMETFYVLKI